jgi:membrane-associated phospholipid phosphatase
VNPVDAAQRDPVADAVGPRPVTEAPPGADERPTARWITRRGREAHRELVVGGVLLALVAVGGLFLSFRPAHTVLDGWILGLVGPDRSAGLTRVTALRFPQVIVAGSVVAAVVAYPADRLRALACLVAPPLALATCELVVKPLVGRHLGAGLSYPSGSTVGAAALAAAVVLAVPTRWRTLALVAGAAYTLWMSVAVIALQWHLPTDALAGAAYGAGVVLVVDGAVWALGAGVRGGTAWRRPATSRGG